MAKDAIDLLKSENKTVRELLKKLSETAGRAAKARLSLLAQIETELTIHTTIEEEIVYPAFKSASGKEGKQLFFEAKEEHIAADMVLKEVGRVRTSADEFSARAKVLKELVEHHAEEEQGRGEEHVGELDLAPAPAERRRGGVPPRTPAHALPARSRPPSSGRRSAGARG